MQKQNADQSLKCRLNQRQSWKVALRLLVIALLSSLALGSAVLTYPVLTSMAPKLPYRPAGIAAHLAWYFQGGQLKAEVRTYAAMFRYFVIPEKELPTVVTFTNLPVAEKAGSSKPIS